MNGPRIEVQELRIRVAGLEPSAAHRLGAEVARRLAGELAGIDPAGAPGGLRLRVPAAAAGEGLGDLTDRITSAVLKGLR
ncbi:hypothetical protein [Streptomyces sp. NPDC059874]|uniref:hypothetical protein n=1 Tax=Streptomyces sp. NPDC059874 TaxID=3346983 RepID=UPI00365FCA37